MSAWSRWTGEAQDSQSKIGACSPDRCRLTHIFAPERNAHNTPPTPFLCIEKAPDRKDRKTLTTAMQFAAADACVMQRYPSDKKNGENLGKAEYKMKSRSSAKVDKGRVKVKASKAFPSTPSSPEKSKRSRSPTKKTVRKAATTTDVESYESWDFGKVKTFKRPKDNAKNNKAATTIERFVRGWWARQHYRIRVLEFKLKNKDLLTKRALAKVNEKKKVKQDKFRKKMEDKHNASVAEVTEEDKNAQEAHKLIKYLRDENKKLREKNGKIIDACRNLNSQNERLQSTTSVAEGNIDVLNVHAKQIKDTHEKLKVVEPRYRESVEQLSEAVELRRQFCLTERKIKLMYVKCVGAIVDIAEEVCKDAELVDEIVEYVLETEDADDAEPVTVKLDLNEMETGEEEAEDSDNYDEFSVATYDS